MAPGRRQASRRRASADTAQPLPGWLWGLAGLAAGAVISSVYFSDQMQSGSASRSDGSGAGAGQASGTESAAVRPRFDFYSLLPELEVVVPGSPPAQAPAPVPPPVQAPTQAPTPAQPTPPAQAPTPPQPPAPVPAPAQAPTPPQPPAPAARPGTYFLQVGSFRQFEEADRLRASLAMLGVLASIEPVGVNTETWHRVRVGPFNDLAEFNRVRDRLRANQIDSFMVRD